LKVERVWLCDHAHQSEAIHDASRYIVAFYNSQHLSFTLDNQSPNYYKQHMAEEQPISVREKNLTTTTWQIVDIRFVV